MQVPVNARVPDGQLPSVDSRISLPVSVSALSFAPVTERFTRSRPFTRLTAKADPPRARNSASDATTLA